MSRSDNYWSTDSEIRFLENLGSYAEKGKKTPEELYENYIRAASTLRKKWAGIDKRKVIEKAEELLEKCRYSYG